MVDVFTDLLINTLFSSGLGGRGQKKLVKD
jgi:hypothetical protein